MAFDPLEAQVTSGCAMSVGNRRMQPIPPTCIIGREFAWSHNGTERYCKFAPFFGTQITAENRYNMYLDSNAERRILTPKDGKKKNW